MSQLYLYSIFHLNLAFSSIEEEQRPEVIQRCYWPLLRLIRKHSLPVAVEATAYTLETIAAHDPEWVEELRQLCAEGIASFVGSGYAQLIGPLVPAEVNRQNQHIGLRRYEALLGFRPTIALVNEQAYSSGMVSHYLDAGYQAIVMEWDNPGSYNPDWNRDLRYLPQRACGTQGETIPLIWNKSIPFQKFQRYAHGEMTLDAYLAYLETHRGETDRIFSLYGNDAEIFDFRPGRFATEAKLESSREWERIEALYLSLLDDAGVTLTLPERALSFLEHPKAGGALRLETVQHPIPVKKQAKYNICRWAVTGRADLTINSDCWEAYERLRGLGAKATPGQWRELCYLWSSDFRTHITPKRWKNYRKRLGRFLATLEPAKKKKDIGEPVSTGEAPVHPDIEVRHEGDFLSIRTPRLSLRFNCRRGMALDALALRRGDGEKLLGTLEHGYYDQIAFGADFYSGHLAFEIPGRHQITDLVAVSPELLWNERGLSLRCRIHTELGPLEKQWHLQAERDELVLEYRTLWPSSPGGSLRLGHLTLNPAAFDPAGLEIRTNNGGEEERFLLRKKGVNHAAPVSALVSANQGFGVTEGRVFVGDGETTVTVELEKGGASLIALMRYEPLGERFFARLFFSAQEQDDTSCKEPKRKCFQDRTFRFLWRIEQKK